MSKLVPALAALMLLAGCAATAPVEVGVDHPASAEGAEAPMPARSYTLAIEGETLPPACDEREGMGHGMHRGHGMDHARPATRAGEAAAPSAPRWTPATVPTTGPTTTGAVYRCPMHPEVVSDQPGKCPKCGMKLMPKQKGEPAGDGGHGGHP